MIRFFIRRAVQGFPVLIGLSLVAFALMHLAPGGPASVYADNPYIGSEDIERLEQKLGLHDPIPIQYLKWAGGLVVGEWGNSYRNGTPVIEVIVEQIPATIELMGIAILVALVIGVSVGTVAAIKPYSFFDQITSTATMFALSIPSFWFSLIVIYIFSVKLGWLPSGGMSTPDEPFSIADWLLHLVAPAGVLGVIMSATWARYTRTSLREVLSQDYMKTARSKGLPEWIVIGRHGLRNALLPLITLGGLQLPHILAGALVVETVFSWPGMGRLFFESLSTRDYPVMMAILMLAGFLVFVGNLLADVGYALSDPRIRDA